MVTGEKCTRLFKKKLFQKSVLRDCIFMCFDICTLNIRVSIRARGLHIVFFPPAETQIKWELYCNKAYYAPGVGSHADGVAYVGIGIGLF